MLAEYFGMGVESLALVGTWKFLPLALALHLVQDLDTMFNVHQSVLVIKCPMNMPA